MTTLGTHPFATLRRRIRQSAQQFRQNNDNSQSLFHPDGGFIYAYMVDAVEAALDEYEQTLDTDYQENRPPLTPIEYLRREASTISKTHTSLDARSFAQDVLELLDGQLREQTPPNSPVQLRVTPT